MSPSIDRINPTTGAQSLVVFAEAWSGSPLSLPQKMVLTPDGNIVVSNAEYDDGVTGIFKVNATTGRSRRSRPAASSPTLKAPVGLLLNPTNPNQLYMTVDDTATASKDGLYALNLTTGAETAISTGGLLQSSGVITEGLSGDLLVLSNSGVVDVNPTTGAKPARFGKRFCDSFQRAVGADARAGDGRAVRVGASGVGGRRTPQAAKAGGVNSAGSNDDSGSPVGAAFFCDRASQPPRTRPTGNGIVLSARFTQVKCRDIPENVKMLKKLVSSYAVLSQLDDKG